MFDEDEIKQVKDELLRLGRKYVKIMDAGERHILHHSLLYQYLTLSTDMELAVDGIVKV